ncbi:hypothetical protein FI667_g5839, partial [Globisporangium splendens]
MLANVKIAVFAALCGAALVSLTSAKPAYSAKIPNGEAMGKSLGHTSDGYTAFGTMFSEAGLSWSAVCKKTWPGSSITVGSALGDPCCKWTGGDADFKLSAPKADGTTCAATTTAPAATKAPATTTAPAATKAPATTTAPAATTAAPVAAKTTPAPASAAATPSVTPAKTTPSGKATTPAATPAATIPSGLLCE